MSFHKKVKFPFEVTKGKAKDLFKLRFIRKSELEPSVQHTMRHTVNLMGRQLDLWFKEQSFTIGSITKEQDKVYQSRRRLRKELRRIKRVEYARRQEDIRDRLERIRRNMLAMKVVQKFKENIRISREEKVRQANDSVRGNTVEGDSISVQDHKQENSADVVTMITDGGSKRRFTKSSDLENRDGQSGELPKLSQPNSTVQSWRESAANFRGALSDSSSDEEGEEGEAGSERRDNHDDETRASLQRYPSSHGPRMETILEESVDEVEVEMEDLRVQKPRLTKRSLHLLNRSQATKNIFDTPGGVTLLPDISQHARAQQTATPTEKHLTDTFDKETQTSFESRSHKTRRHKKKRHREDGGISKDDVVRIPTSSNVKRRPKARPGFADFKHTRRDANGQMAQYAGPDGSTGLDSYEGDLDLSDWDSSSTESDNVFSHEETGQRIYPLDFQAPFPGPGKMTDFPHIPAELIAADLGMLHRLYEQNPFSLQFRERSFYLKSPVADNRPGSADTCGSRERRRGSDTLRTSQPEMVPIKTLTLDDIKGKRLEDIRKEMNKHCAQINLRETPTMAVIGKKSKEMQEKHIAPPNSPIAIRNIARANEAATPKLSGQLPMVIQSQRRDRETNRQKIHELVSKEPVQQYERTKSGRLLPFGSPRVAHHEIPSMKDKYYRDKLLKAERGTILSQKIKMKRFMNRISSDCDVTKLPPIAGDPPAPTTARTANAPKKSLSNLFKVHQSNTITEDIQEVVPSMNTSPINMLRKCRYIREYIPLSDKERLTSQTERETSWKKSYQPYDVNHIASMQLQQAAYCSL